MGATQVRTSPGGFVGYDYTALKILARDMGIQTTPALWSKVQVVESVTREKAEQQARQEQQRARHGNKSHPVRRR